MKDILERIKDAKTSIPGAIAGIWAVIDTLGEYGIRLDISQRTAANIALFIVGVGLLLSGSKSVAGAKDDEK